MVQLSGAGFYALLWVFFYWVFLGGFSTLCSSCVSTRFEKIWPKLQIMHQKNSLSVLLGQGFGSRIWVYCLLEPFSSSRSCLGGPSGKKFEARAYAECPNWQHSFRSGTFQGRSLNAQNFDCVKVKRFWGLVAVSPSPNLLIRWVQVIVS